MIKHKNKIYKELEVIHLTQYKIIYNKYQLHMLLTVIWYSITNIIINNNSNNVIIKALMISVEKNLNKEHYCKKRECAYTFLMVM